MPDMKVYPIPVGKGGGAHLINGLKSGNVGGAHLAPDLHWCFGYKLKVDGSGYWDDLRATALAGAGSQVITLATTFPHRPVPTNIWIHRIYIRLITAFSGGAISAATLSLGDTGN